MIKKGEGGVKKKVQGCQKEASKDAFPTLEGKKKVEKNIATGSGRGFPCSVLPYRK